MCAEVNDITTIHNGRVFKIVSEDITLANGVSTNMEIIRHPGASAIVPFLNHDTIILIRQYRHAIGDYIWEIPAGTFDPSETALVCAKRELIEETGYMANEWQKLNEITPVPAYSDERIHIFFATDLEPAEQNLDKDEILEVHEIKFTKALDMIYRGEIQDSKTICGLFMAAQLQDK